ncbi:hypothetical protein [Paenibacillus sp. UNC496MF]|uniref:hypothetical protein n=1 Tax=Paenibacillus sp. UNC496MF TaxID=1502753 RepID=UPI0015A5340B|nr:hypothetical protein [Paenibacillus sp. UNC496MF]
MGSGLLLSALSTASGSGWNWNVFLLLAAALILWGSFILIKRNASFPLVPKAVIRIATMQVGVVIGILAGSHHFSMFFLLTLYMQDVLHLSVIQTSLGYLAAAQPGAEMMRDDIVVVGGYGKVGRIICEELTNRWPGKVVAAGFHALPGVKSCEFMSLREESESFSRELNYPPNNIHNTPNGNIPFKEYIIFFSPVMWESKFTFEKACGFRSHK